MLRPCPFCAESIQAAAVKCRFCSQSVEPIRVAPPTGTQGAPKPNGNGGSTAREMACLDCGNVFGGAERCPDCADSELIATNEDGVVDLLKTAAINNKHKHVNVVTGVGFVVGLAIGVGLLVLLADVPVTRGGIRIRGFAFVASTIAGAAFGRTIGSYSYNSPFRRWL
jgi:hypothetical protein